MRQKQFLIVVATLHVIVACGDDADEVREDAGMSASAGRGGMSAGIGGTMGGRSGAGTGGKAPLSSCAKLDVAECAGNPSCTAVTARRNCDRAPAPVLCAPKPAMCGAQIFCAKDPDGVLWMFGSLCGRTEATELGWKISSRCECGQDGGSDDAG